ncbi:MAG TPA: hypothetical protein VFO35_07725, partial [Steroidobacteraceae bacterium]|nr:hypothetical protein [Steroidobacteraceae bacterium]
MLLTILAAPISSTQAAEAPTPEQLEAFRNLPPDQQQAVLEAMTNPDGAAAQEPQPEAQQIPAQQRSVRRPEPEP